MDGAAGPDAQPITIASPPTPQAGTARPTTNCGGVAVRDTLKHRLVGQPIQWGEPTAYAVGQPIKWERVSGESGLGLEEAVG
ncbi:hypothetical protein GCM10029976_011510 [Kribbella albertanoniae]